MKNYSTLTALSELDISQRQSIQEIDSLYILMDKILSNKAKFKEHRRFSHNLGGELLNLQLIFTYNQARI